MELNFKSFSLFICFSTQRKRNVLSPWSRENSWLPVCVPVDINTFTDTKKSSQTKLTRYSMSSLFPEIMFCILVCICNWTLKVVPVFNVLGFGHSSFFIFVVSVYMSIALSKWLVPLKGVILSSTQHHQKENVSVLLEFVSNKNVAATWHFDYWRTIFMYKAIIPLALSRFYIVNFTKPFTPGIWRHL